MKRILSWSLLGFIWAQQDAATRALLNKYDVKFWWLNIQATHTSYELGPSWVLTRLEVTAPDLDTLAFELHSSVTVDSVLLNGQRMSFLRRGHTLRIPLSPRPVQGSLLEAVVHYRWAPTGSQSSLPGLNNRQSPSWGNWVTWTLSQPFEALGWWPTKQILTDKADSVWTFLTVPLGTRAGAVGVLEGIDTLPNNRVRFRWKSRYPIVYYLVAFSVAEYIDYSFYAQVPGVSQPVLVQNYIYDNPQVLSLYKAQIDTTAALLREFSLRFGPYPFWREKYGHMMAPFSGGMEHQTMTTQGYFDFSLTAHELAHQWFGDWVTCASWQDIWLNEGFANYSEYIALQALGTPVEARNWLINEHNQVVARNRGSVWVPDTLDAGRIFSYRLSYAKGAYLLHMIRFRLANDSLFWAILRTYLDQNAAGVAWQSTFQGILEQATGESWADFFQQWYYGEGHPILNVRWNENEGDLWISVSQSGSWSLSVPFFRTPIEIRAIRQGLPDTTIQLFLSQPLQTFFIQGVGAVNSIQVDPEYWILRQLSSLQRDSTLGVRGRDGERSLWLSPNPVKQGEELFIQLPASGRLTIHDMQGRVLYEEIHLAPFFRWTASVSAGYYQVVWTGLNGASQRQALLILP
ncbi:MAG: M1 family aminopeptidase [Bacteroidia bacterium]|nr:M1 family aminopeptidase [Bacteroidia bacterium]